MAEVGLRASATQVAGAGLKLSQTLYQYAEPVASADQRLRSIAKEVQLTSFVIDELGHVFKQDHTATSLSENAIKTADETVQECSVVFTNMQADIKKSTKGKPGRLMLPIPEPKLELIRDHLDKLKSTLQLQMHVLTHAHHLAPQERDHKTEEGQCEQLKLLMQIEQRSKQKYERSLSNYSFSEENTLIGDREVQHVYSDEDAKSVSVASVGAHLTVQTLQTCVQHIQGLLAHIEFIQHELTQQAEGADSSEHLQSLIGSYLHARAYLDTVILGSSERTSSSPKVVSRVPDTLSEQSSVVQVSSEHSHAANAEASSAPNLISQPSIPNPASLNQDFDFNSSGILPEDVRGQTRKQKRRKRLKEQQSHQKGTLNNEVEPLRMEVTGQQDRDRDQERIREENFSSRRTDIHYWEDEKLEDEIDDSVEKLQIEEGRHVVRTEGIILNNIESRPESFGVNDLRSDIDGRSSSASTHFYNENHSESGDPTTKGKDDSVARSLNETGAENPGIRLSSHDGRESVSRWSDKAAVSKESPLEAKSLRPTTEEVEREYEISRSKKRASSKAEVVVRRDSDRYVSLRPGPRGRRARDSERALAGGVVEMTRAFQHRPSSGSEVANVQESTEDSENALQKAQIQARLVYLNKKVDSQSVSTRRKHLLETERSDLEKQLQRLELQSQVRDKRNGTQDLQEEPHKPRHGPRRTTSEQSFTTLRSTSFERDREESAGVNKGKAEERVDKHQLRFGQGRYQRNDDEEVHARRARRAHARKTGLHVEDDPERYAIDRTKSERRPRKHSRRSVQDEAIQDAEPDHHLPREVGYSYVGDSHDEFYARPLPSGQRPKLLARSSSLSANASMTGVDIYDTTQMDNEELIARPPRGPDRHDKNIGSKQYVKIHQSRTRGSAEIPTYEAHKAVKRATRIPSRRSRTPSSRRSDLSVYETYDTNTDVHRLNDANTEFPMSTQMPTAWDRTRPDLSARHSMPYPGYPTAGAPPPSIYWNAAMSVNAHGSATPPYTYGNAGMTHFSHNPAVPHNTGYAQSAISSFDAGSWETDVAERVETEAYDRALMPPPPIDAGRRPPLQRMPHSQPYALPEPPSLPDSGASRFPRMQDEYAAIGRRQSYQGYESRNELERKHRDARRYQNELPASLEIVSTAPSGHRQHDFTVFPEIHEEPRVEGGAQAGNVRLEPTSTFDVAQRLEAIARQRLELLELRVERNAKGTMTKDDRVQQQVESRMMEVLNQAETILKDTPSDKVGQVQEQLAALLRSVEPIGQALQERQKMPGAYESSDDEHYDDVDDIDYVATAAATRNSNKARLEAERKRSERENYRSARRGQSASFSNPLHDQTNHEAGHNQNYEVYRQQGAAPSSYSHAPPGHPPQFDLPIHSAPPLPQQQQQQQQQHYFAMPAASAPTPHNHSDFDSTHYYNNSDHRMQGADYEQQYFHDSNGTASYPPGPPQYRH